MKRILAMAALLLMSALPAAAEEGDVAAAPPLEPQVQNGVSFLSGGVGDAEQERLRGLDDDYNVRIALTRPDGAYLADVRLVVEDAAGKPLVETTTRGPIFLAELAPGRYALRAESEGHAAERRVIDVPQQRDPIRLYVALTHAGEAASETQAQ